MELLEYAASQLHFYLSDFHYTEKLMAAKYLLYDLIEAYTIEEWLQAYEYIFYDEKEYNFESAKEVYEAIYERVTNKGTPMDTKPKKVIQKWKNQVHVVTGKQGRL